MQLYRVIIVIMIICVVTILFRVAGGSLKFTKLNMISTIYYYTLVFNLIGGSLIYLGMRDHYLIQKLQFKDSIDFTYYALSYSLIMFPLVLWITKRVIEGVLKKKSINTYISESICYNDDMFRIQNMVFLLTAVCTLATVYVFLNLGYIPVVSMFKSDNLDALRQSASRSFAGNQYVKNLIMHTLTPIISYLAFIYYRITKSRTWKITFFYLAFLSVIILTYDFSKSPIINYLLGLYLIEVVIGNIRSSKKFSTLIFSAGLLILFFYTVMMDAKSSLFSIYTGPLGRILFTQIATLFLHVEAFPLRHDFLLGASFNKWMSFFIPNAEGIRSGRVVMTIYNAAGVEANTAGVMNTIFIGEAYANYGITGIIIAPIIFGIVIGAFAYIIPQLRKKPVTILLYVQMTLQFVTIVEAGFVDIFYSASFLFIGLIIIIIHYATGRWNNKKLTALEIQATREKIL